MANFALGLKYGVDAGSRIVDTAWKSQENERKRKEWEREDEIRREAQNTLGNIGTDREDGSVYSETQGMRDYANRIAGLDPARSLAARQGADAMELRGLQKKSAERAARYEDMADNVLQLQQQLAAGADPTQVYQNAAKLFNQVQDGRFAGMTDDGRSMTIFDVNSGRTKIVPFSPENVMKAIDGFHALASPKALQDARALGLQERGVAATEGQLGVAQQNANTNEQYRRDLALVLRAQADYYNRRPGTTQKEPPAELIQDVNTRYEEYQAAIESGDKNKIRTARRAYDAAVTRAATAAGKFRTLGTAGEDRQAPDPRQDKGLELLAGLGARPTDKKAAVKWDADAAHIKSVYGLGNKDEAPSLVVPPPPTQRGARLGVEPEPNRPAPLPGAGVAQYGPLTPWSTIEAAARAGDPAAIDYARRRNLTGPGLMGTTIPESMREFLREQYGGM